MAKDINQIIADMDAAQAAESDLSGLTSGSSTALHKLFKYVVALVYVTLYKAWDSVLAEFEALAQSYIIGTRAWYVQLALDYSGGTLIKKANCQDVGTKVILKVAKEVSGATVNLTTTELANFADYVNAKKVAGTDIDVLSQTADLVDITMSIQYVGTQAVVEADVIAAIKAYLATHPFGQDLSKTLLTDAILDVTGVLNAYIDILNINTNGSWVTVTGNYGTTDAGYWEVGKNGSSQDLITLNMYV